MPVLPQQVMDLAVLNHVKLADTGRPVGVLRLLLLPPGTQCRAKPPKPAQSQQHPSPETEGSPQPPAQHGRTDGRTDGCSQERSQQPPAVPPGTVAPPAQRGTSRAAGDWLRAE
uniref:Uncharacterized protein n=1 Tax=Thermogemmatispora argillosa TaxID=2045280 RepID=A0A455SY71_9CHLR|nr:hypothetical protein KTA_02580 [Thermogemmatispora argillosa]